MTLAGIVMLVRAVHWVKADGPIVVTVLGMVMLLNAVQRTKALSWIDNSPSGKVTEVSDVHW